MSFFAGKEKIRMFLANVLEIPEYLPIKNKYEYFLNYMDQHVEFWLPESEIHTKSHCARVLMHALIIGHKKGLSETEMDALGMAAIFHDSRRLDDGLDVGHGKRAAAYYKAYCGESDLPYDISTYYITYYHDRDDTLGLSEIRKSQTLGEQTVLLYQIFKDADALDRFRLGPDALDERFHRTEEAKKLVDFVRNLYHKSNEINL